MPTPDELLAVEVRFDEQLLDDIDRFRRRSAHASRSEVVSAAIERRTDESDHSP